MALAPSSIHTYQRGQLAYLEFCLSYYLHPYPLSEDSVCLFVTFLAGFLSYSTIMCYLLAIRNKNGSLGFNYVAGALPQLRVLLRGVKRTKGSTVLQKRAPITHLKH